MKMSAGAVVEVVYKMYSDLINFIENNPDWKEKLKKAPYSLKSVKDHPSDESLTMLTYNLFESDLSSPIVQACRGSVVRVKDGNCKVVCAPFYKFFNYGESNAADIDWSSAKVQQKIDGMLVKCYKLDGTVYFTTNGSFCFNVSVEDSFHALTNEQPLNNFFEVLQYALAPQGVTVDMRWDGTVVGAGGFCNNLKEGWTLFFELVSPWFRIICSYDKTEIYLTGGRGPDMEEHTTSELRDLFGIYLPVPKEYDWHSMDEALNGMKSWNGAEKEGVVVVDKMWNRVKVKCDDYLKLKFLKGEDNFSYPVLLLAAMNETIDDLVGSFPSLKDRADEAIKDWQYMVKGFEAVVEKAKEARASFDSQKEFADWVISEVPEWKAYFFAAAKGCDIEFLKKDVEKVANGSFATRNLLQLRDKLSGFLASVNILKKIK